MAQIINKSITTNLTDAMNTLIADLRSVFDFKRYDDENHRLYITDDTYVEIYGYSSSFSIKIGNSHGQLLQLSESSVSGVYYQIIKTASGDIALRLYKQALVDNKYLQIAILRVIDTDGNESYAVYSPADAGQGVVNTNMIPSVTGYMTLIADDTDTPGNTQICQNADSTSANLTPLAFGFNPSAKTAKPISIFGTFTNYMSKTAKIFAQTPRPYNGESKMYGKNYYCVSFLALLDE